MCVIDHAGDGDRPSAWLRAGSSAVVGEDEPFDQLFQTVTELLRISPALNASRDGVASQAGPPARRRGSRLDLFDRLTDVNNSCCPSSWRAMAQKNTRKRPSCRSRPFDHR